MNPNLINSRHNVIYEECPHCEREVALKDKFEIQECPNCFKPIKPCSLCEVSMYCIIEGMLFNCETECPLDKHNTSHCTENILINNNKLNNKDDILINKSNQSTMSKTKNFITSQLDEVTNQAIETQKQIHKLEIESKTIQKAISYMNDDKSILIEKARELKSMLNELTTIEADLDYYNTYYNQECSKLKPSNCEDACDSNCKCNHQSFDDESDLD